MFNYIIILFALIFSFSLDSMAVSPEVPAGPTSISAVTGYCSGVNAAAILKSCAKLEATEKTEIAKDMKILETLSSQISTINSQTTVALCGAPVDPHYAACVAAVPSANASLTLAQNLIEPAKTAQTECVSTSSKAGVMCALSSPQAQAGAAIMNQLSNSLSSTTSAKETCSSTGIASFAGQGVLAAGILVCGKNKGLCESSCSAVNTENLEIIIAHLQAAKQTLIAGFVPSGSEISTPITVATNKKSENSAAVARCSSYASGLADLMQTAGGLLQSANEAKGCSEQLAGSKTGAQTVTEMCALAANASSAICQCRVNNAAQGCPGYVASLGNESSLKALNPSGASNLASLSAGKIVPASNAGYGLGDLSDEAKQALKDAGDVESAPGFSAASGANAGGGGSTAAGSAPAGKEGKAAEENRSIGSSFVSAVGSLFRGSSGGSGGRPSENKLQADRYAVAKRQLAVEQLRSEISGASGLDNFAKINRRYKSNVDTLMDGK